MRPAVLIALATACGLAAPAAATRPPTFFGTIADPGREPEIPIPFFAGPIFGKDRTYTLLVKFSRPATFISAAMQRQIAFGSYFEGDFSGDDYRLTYLVAGGADTAMASGRFVLPASFDTTFVDDDGVYHGSYEYYETVAGWLDYEFASPTAVDYSITIFASQVPEPLQWAMLITGFALAGAAQRARRASA